MSLLEMLFALYCLGTGIVLGYLWTRPEKMKMIDLETQLKWKSALVEAQALDLARCRTKLEALPRKTKKA
jgi:hypothetical protein